jgi:SAM-dependent methyltransferase
MANLPPIPPPSPWVDRFIGLVRKGGTVLDLACGSGRHAIVAGGLGYRVTALDRDVSRLAADGEMEIVEADLESGAPWPLPDRRFDGIVVTNYLHRPLFPVLIDSLSPGGVLIYETFAVGNEKYGRPRNPDFLLRDGELLDAFAGGLSVIAYEGGVVDHPAPAVIQRIAAVKPDAGGTAITLPA